MRKIRLTEKNLQRIIKRVLNEGQLLTEDKISCCIKKHEDYDRGCCGRMRKLCCSYPNSSCCESWAPPTGPTDTDLDVRYAMNENYIINHPDPFKAGMLTEKANRAKKYQIAESYGLLLEEPKCCTDKYYDSNCCEDIMNACCNEKISCCEDGWGDDNFRGPRGPRGQSDWVRTRI